MGYDYEENNAIDDISDSFHQTVNATKNITTFANNAKKFASSHGSASNNGFRNSNSKGNVDSFSKQASSSALNNASKSTSNLGVSSTTQAGASTSTAASVGTGVAGTGATASASAGAGTTATAGTAAAAGTATAGIGAIVVLAMSAIKKGIDAEKKNSEEISGQADSGMGVIATIVFAVIASLFILVSIIVAPAIVVYNVYVKPVVETFTEVKDNVESYLAEEQKREFFEDLFGKDYDAISTSPREINEETIEVYKDIVDFSIEQAFDTYVWNLLFDLNTWKAFMFDGYNPYATYQKFLDNPYPYALAKSSDGKPYTIREFLDNPDAIENNDLNYAEIFAIFCQKKENSFITFSYSDFYDLMVSKQTTELLFEMEIGDIHYYSYNEGESQSALKDGSITGSKTLSNTLSLNSVVGHTEYSEQQMEDHMQEIFKSENIEENEDEESNWWNIICNAWTAFWNNKVEIAEQVMDKIISWGSHFFFVYDVTVKPYGLEEMYSIIETSPDAYNTNIPSMRNYELLDYQEQWLRELVPNTDLGPSYAEHRNVRSTIYQNIQNCLQKDSSYGTYVQPTGRSLSSYLDNSLVNIAINGNNYYQEWNTSRIHYEINYNPNGESVILDMYSYINQGDYPNDKRGPATSTVDQRDTIRESGCIDCSYVMLYEYYFRNELNVPFVSLNYVRNNQFLTSQFLRDYNLMPGITGSGNTSFSEGTVIKQLTEGKPVIMYLEGRWAYGNRTLHGSENGHFLVLVGYDDIGFYVYDPGSRTNTMNGCIPYAAFDYLPIKYLRTVSPMQNTEYSITYKINTISGIGVENEK